MIEWLKANPAAFAAVCTVIGAVALKFVERWLGKSAESRADRADYREEIKSLNERIDKLEGDLRQVRNDYYSTLEHNAHLRTTLIKNGLTPPPMTG